MSTFSKRLLCPVVVTLAATAVTSPLARAQHAREEAPTVEATASIPAVSVNREQDRLGPKYVPLHRPATAHPTSVVTVVKPAGFDWADAGVGAGVAGLALAAVAGVATLVTRRSRDDAAPQQRELAGT